MRRWFGLVTIIVAILILPAGHILPVQSQGGNPDISITCSPTGLEYGVLPLNSTSEYSNTMITYCDLSNPTSYNESVNIQITAAGLEYRSPDSVFVGPYSTVTFELEIYGNISDDDMSRQVTVSARVDQADGAPCPTCTSQTTSMLVVASEIQTDDNIGFKLEINLNSWQANSEEIWDQDESPPDPQFRICAADVLSNWDECVNSPTWTDSWNISSGWNASFLIPAGTHFINFTIECEDDDALNDDECDMNSQANEWRQYFVYSQALGNETTFWGNGLADGDSSNRDAMSNWSIYVDYDSDRDGVWNDEDGCPNTPGDSTMDRLGCPDNDGDGYSNGGDVFIYEPTQWNDTDGDMFGDNNGPNDYNGDDCPNEPGVASGTNGTGCPIWDPDSDGDGIPDSSDDFPNNPAEWNDSDGDGVGDNSDEFPYNFLESADSDGDGVGDNSDAFPNDSTETTDTDGDGYGDNRDEFPLEPDRHSSSESSSTSNRAGAGACGFISLAFVVAVFLGIYVLFDSTRKKPSKPKFVQQVPVTHVIQQQQIQASVNQLDQQRRQALYEAEQLRRQLSDSASYTAAQMQSMQEEMARLQETVALAEQEKTEMQDELEKAKSTTVVQNITYNIQDSAISGDINATGLKEKDD